MVSAYEVARVLARRLLVHIHPIKRAMNALNAMKAEMPIT